MSKIKPTNINTLFSKDDVVIEWCSEDFLGRLRKHPIVKEEYERLYLGGWNNPEHPTPYKESVDSLTWENIYEHSCPCCKRSFYGYKARTVCLDCKKGGYRDET